MSCFCLKKPRWVAFLHDFWTLSEVRKVTEASGITKKLQKKLIFINSIVLCNPLEDTQFSLLRALMSQFVIWYFVEFAVNWKKWILLLNFYGKLNQRNFVLQFREGSYFIFCPCLSWFPISKTVSYMCYRPNKYLQHEIEFGKFSFFGVWNWKKYEARKFCTPNPREFLAYQPPHYPSEVSAFPGAGDENKPTGKQDVDLLIAGQGLNHSNSRQIWRIGFKSWAAQLVKNPPAMQETLVHFLGQEVLLEKG